MLQMGAKPVPLEARIRRAVFPSRKKALPKGPSMATGCPARISRPIWVETLPRSWRRICSVRLPTEHFCGLVLGDRTVHCKVLKYLARPFRHIFKPNHISGIGPN